MRIWALAAACVFGAVPLAAAQPPRVSLSGELVMGGGYDSNAFLRIEPTLPAGSTPLRGPFLHIGPMFAAATTLGPVRLEGAYAADWRSATAPTRLFTQEGSLELGLPAWGPLRARIGAAVGSFSSSEDDAQDFRFFAASAGARVQLGSAARLLTSTRIEARRHDKSGDDVLLSADARVPVRFADLFEAAPVVSFVRVPAFESPAFARTRLGVSASLVTGPLTTRALAFVGWRAPTETPTRTEVGASADVRVRLWRWLDALASASISAVPAAGPLEPNLDRRAVLLGLAVFTDGAVSLPATDQPSCRPMSLSGGRVRFRHRAAARTVSVIGSWNDWRSPGDPLSRNGELWEATVAIPPGTHRYRFVVDGTTARPLDAESYAADDFGGEDAVLVHNQAP